jgi:hypothetical protein
MEYQGSQPIAKAVLLMQGYAGFVGSMGATLSLIVATSTSHTFRLNIQKGNSE